MDRQWLFAHQGSPRPVHRQLSFAGLLSEKMVPGRSLRNETAPASPLAFRTHFTPLKLFKPKRIHEIFLTRRGPHRKLKAVPVPQQCASPIAAGCPAAPRFNLPEGGRPWQKKFSSSTATTRASFSLRRGRNLDPGRCLPKGGHDPPPFAHLAILCEISCDKDTLSCETVLAPGAAPVRRDLGPGPGLRVGHSRLRLDPAPVAEPLAPAAKEPTAAPEVQAAADIRGQSPAPHQPAKVPPAPAPAPPPVGRQAPDPGRPGARPLSDWPGHRPRAARAWSSVRKTSRTISWWLSRCYRRSSRPPARSCNISCRRSRRRCRCITPTCSAYTAPAGPGRTAGSPANTSRATTSWRG